LTLTLPDATENETTRLLRGTYAPLNAPNGIPLTYASGAWQATVCLEVNASYTYWFDFTERDDAGSPTFEEDLRYNPALPNEGNGRGGRLNVVAPIPSCASIDASVGPSAH